MPRPVCNTRTASKKSYELFCEKYKNIDISYDEYKKILYYYNSLIAEHLIITGEEIKLPYGIGAIKIVKYRPKKNRLTKEGKERISYPIDFKLTKELGKTVYFLNHHTEGYRFYYLWRPNKAKLKCAIIWKLEMVRIHKRALVKVLKKPEFNFKDIYTQYSKFK